jgi:hypothetical protein
MDFIAEFNKLINVKAFFRTIGGKKVPVKGFRRKVLAVQAGLRDLNRTSGGVYETGYNFNTKSGKLGKLAHGSSASISPIAIYGNKVKYRDLKTKSGFLHNHPDASSFSPADIVTTTRGNDIYAINTQGSIFRARAKHDLGKANPGQQGEILDKLDNQYENMSTFLLSKQQELIDKGVVKRQLLPNEVDFLTSHAFNLNLHRRGVINYRYKLGEVDKKQLENNKEIFDSLMRGDPMPSKKYTLEDWSMNIQRPFSSAYHTIDKKSTIGLQPEQMSSRLNGLLTLTHYGKNKKVRQKAKLKLRKLVYNQIHQASKDPRISKDIIQREKDRIKKLGLFNRGTSHPHFLQQLSS